MASTRQKKGLDLRGWAVNHVCRPGSVVRWPQGVRWTLSVYQERSHDRSAEWIHMHCRFCPVSGSFYGFIAWVGRTWTSKKWGRKRAPMRRNGACFQPRWKLTFSMVHTYVGQNRTTVLVPECGPVRRISHWTTYSFNLSNTKQEWLTSGRLKFFSSDVLLRAKKINKNKMASIQKRLICFLCSGIGFSYLCLFLGPMWMWIHDPPLTFPLPSIWHRRLSSLDLCAVKKKKKWRYSQ